MKGKLHILLKWLSHFGFKISKNDLKIRLLSDSGQGITPISNTLDYFKIKNITATVPKSSLDQLPTCFIAQILRDEQHDLVLLSKREDGGVEIVIDERNDERMSKEEFMSIWTGLIIAIERNEDIKALRLDELNYGQMGIVICAILLIAYVGFTSFSIIKMLYILSIIFGLVVSYLILKEKLNIDETPSRFCSFSKDTDCKRVLNSKESSLISFVDLSDASIIYFSCLLLSYIAVPHSVVYLGLASFSLLVIVYSLYLQYFKIKKWCPLCLSIATLLLFQFILSWLSFDRSTFAILDLLLFSLILIIVSLSWYKIKALLIVQQNNSTLVIDNLLFRRNHELFFPYYLNTHKIDANFDRISDICLGCPDPIVTVLMITNPLCAACFDAHQSLMELVEKYDNKIQIRFRFFVPNEDRKDPRTIIAERLLDLYLHENNHFEEAFQHWYSKVTIHEWLKKWGKCKTENMNAILGDHRAWCLQQDIQYTPAILINEKLFPRLYRTEDIENFLNPLIHMEEQKSALQSQGM